MDRLPRDPIAVLLGLLMFGLLVVCLFGSHWWGKGATELNVLNSNLPPSSEHLLGTDGLGRDVLDRTLVATRLSLEEALLAMATATTLGYTLGMLLAMVGPRMRRMGLGLVEVSLAFPGILVAILIMTVLSPSAWTAALAIGIASVPPLVRISYTVAAGAMASEYIAAARALGVGPARVFVRHLLPNIAEPLLITAAFTIGGCLIAVSALSFLGLGVQAPQFDWGEMLSDGVKYFYVAPAQALAPAVAITTVGLTVGMAGETFARLANPQLRGRRRHLRRASSLAEITGTAEIAKPGAGA